MLHAALIALVLVVVLVVVLVAELDSAPSVVRVVSFVAAPSVVSAPAEQAITLVAITTANVARRQWLMVRREECCTGVPRCSWPSRRDVDLLAMQAAESLRRMSVSCEFSVNPSARNRCESPS